MSEPIEIPHDLQTNYPDSVCDEFEVIQRDVGGNLTIDQASTVGEPGENNFHSATGSVFLNEMAEDDQKSSISEYQPVHGTFNAPRKPSGSTSVHETPIMAQSIAGSLHKDPTFLSELQALMQKVNAAINMSTESEAGESNPDLEEENRELKAKLENANRINALLMDRLGEPKKSERIDELTRINLEMHQQIDALEQEKVDFEKQRQQFQEMLANSNAELNRLRETHAAVAGVETEELVEQVQDALAYSKALEEELRTLRKKFDDLLAEKADKEEIIQVLLEDHAEGTRLLAEHRQENLQLLDQIRERNLDVGVAGFE
ncbi:unnamed protein product, partial [Mesorhabditis spiculigera]